MDCRQLHERLDEGFPGEATAEVREHLSGCASCRRAWALAEQMAATLKALPEPPVPLGFSERALNRTFAAHEQHRRAFVRYWAPALAATFALGIAFGFGLRGLKTVAPSASGYAMQDGRVLLLGDGAVTVRIAVNSTRNIHDVAFVIHIPAGMELQGHPGEQEVAWSGELKQGLNVLGLPLVAEPGSSGVLEAELHHDGLSNVFKVPVAAAAEPGVLGYLRRLLS